MVINENGAKVKRSLAVNKKELLEIPAPESSFFAPLSLSHLTPVTTETELYKYYLKFIYIYIIFQITIY